MFRRSNFNTAGDGQPGELLGTEPGRWAYCQSISFVLISPIATSFTLGVQDVSTPKLPTGVELRYVHTGLQVHAEFRAGILCFKWDYDALYSTSDPGINLRDQRACNQARVVGVHREIPTGRDLVSLAYIDLTITAH